MKKSGLADSPFFTPSPLPNPEVQPVQTPTIGQPLFDRSHAQKKDRSSEQMNKRTDERLNNDTPEQTNKRTDEQMNTRIPEQTSKRTSEQTIRTISRQSYNIFDDQAEAIEVLAFRWRKQRGRHINKGEVMRELLDKALETNG